MENEEKLMLLLLEVCKKDKKLFKSLKDLAIKAQMYELASELRTFEKENFPVTEQELQVQMIGTLLRMTDINSNDRATYIISELMKIPNIMDFSIKEASELKAQAEELFD